MNSTLTRIGVVLKAAPTYLVAASTIITIATEEIADELPNTTAEWVVRVGGKIVSIIGAAVLIIRRSTPVIESQRGLLPVAGAVIPTANTVTD